MKIQQISSLSNPHKESILALWNSEYPIGLAYENMDGFEEYLNKTGEAIHYIIEANNELIGWMATFLRDDERWFSIILKSGHQGKGYGRMLLNEAKKEGYQLNGWVADHNNDLKSNGLTYLSPLAFYLKNGFKILEDVRFNSEKLSAVKIQWNND